MHTSRVSVAAAAMVIGIGLQAAPAARAQANDPNRGRIAFAAGYDFASAYAFRGLIRDDTRLVMWPYAEAAVDLFSGNAGVENVTLHLGIWNSLHTGATGYNGGLGKLWYESDLYATLGVRFGPGVTVSGTYTAYMSPNNSFSTVKEMAVKASVDDAASRVVALRPYGLVAFEFDTLPGLRQADRGLSAGKYLEAGVAPGWATPDFGLEFPIKVGISLDDYYELAGVDQRFGFLSLAAAGTVPFSDSVSYGRWNLHGGVEFLSLGNTPEAFNGGNHTKLIASIGIGLDY